MSTRIARVLRTRRNAIALFVGGSLVGSIVVAAGCSLGLDESLIDRGADAGPASDASMPTIDGTVPSFDSGQKPTDAGVEAGLVATCAKDADCVSNAACLTGRCDLARGACVYDVCPTVGTTCSAAVCTNNKCGTPTKYLFAGNKIAVPSGISCPTISRCIVAVDPWVFVGTNTGVLAYPASPADPNPQPVVVSDVPFTATALVASGTRVYVVGSTLTNGTTVRTEAAWFDTPLSPLVTSIGAHADLITNNKPTGDTLFPMPSQNALVTTNANPLFAGILSAPFDGGINQIDTGDGNPQNTLLGTSGSRLVTFRTNGAASTFVIAPNAGTATTDAGAGIDLSSLGQVVGPVFGSSGPDGSVRAVYATAVVVGANVTYTVHVTQLLDTDVSTTLSTKLTIPVDSFLNPIVAQVEGPTAWIDATSSLVISAVAPNSTSHLQWLDLKKTPPAKFLSFPVTPVQSVGVTSSAGIGWTITADSAAAASLYYIDPACPQTSD